MVQDSINDNTPPNPGPIINLPPATWRLMALLASIHILLWIFDQFTFHAVSNWAYTNLGFMAGRFTGTMPFTPWALLSPISYAFLHGSWLHLGANLLMLMAFGAGCEKLFGARIMLFCFFVTSIGAAVLQFLIAPMAIYPIIGASGGLSGLFGLMIVFMRKNPSDGLRGLLPMIAIWIGISIFTGMIGSPDGSDIAWAAHIGGFLIGIAFGLFLTRAKT